MLYIPNAPQRVHFPPWQGEAVGALQLVLSPFELAGRLPAHAFFYLLMHLADRHGGLHGQVNVGLHVRLRLHRFLHM